MQVTPSREAVSLRFPTQPSPVGLLVIHYPPANPRLTVITREWAAGDHARCRLCPASACTVTAGGACTVVTPGVVPPASAALFRLP